jgi:hypothetical protein
MPAPLELLAGYRAQAAGWAANRLGYADASTTLRIHAHAFEAQDRQAAEVVGVLLPG